MLSMDKRSTLGCRLLYSCRYDQFNEAQRNLLNHFMTLFSLMTSSTEFRASANNRDFNSRKRRPEGLLRESRMALVNRFTARTPSLKEITAKVEKVSSTEVPMLVLGETGCGKRSGCEPDPAAL